MGRALRKTYSKVPTITGAKYVATADSISETSSHAMNALTMFALHQKS